MCVCVNQSYLYYARCHKKCKSDSKVCFSQQEIQKTLMYFTNFLGLDDGLCASQPGTEEKTTNVTLGETKFCFAIVINIDFSIAISCEIVADWIYLMAGLGPDISQISMAPGPSLQFQMGPVQVRFWHFFISAWVWVQFLFGFKHKFLDL